MLHDIEEIKLFPTIPDEMLDELGRHGETVRVPDGTRLFEEGERGYPFFVVLDGKIRITKRIGDEPRLLAIHEHGHFAGEIAMLTGGPAIASGHAIGDTTVVKVDQQELRRIVASECPLAKTLLTAMVSRTQEVNAETRQWEKLAALGKMTAGLAHELNNPAAAARRATAQLRERIEKSHSLCLENDSRFNAEQRAAIFALYDALQENSEQSAALNSLALSDREQELSDWLDSHKVNDGWELAANLAGAGVTVDRLEPLAALMTSVELTAALSWLASISQIDILSQDLESATTRISDLIQAMKDYSYMDQAALQEIDVHRGIESTLRMLAHRMKGGGVTIERQYAPDLPKICAYAGELNQVWTNLIDNALDALQGKGIITIRTASDDAGVRVEIADNGPGIAPENLDRVFEPFFTTKGVGEGLGLGLEITRRIVMRRHHGSIHVSSRPGDTRFVVWLPLQPLKEQEMEQGMTTPVPDHEGILAEHQQ